MVSLIQCWQCCNRDGVTLWEKLLICDSGVVGAELKDKQWSKILSLAPMHL